MRCLQDSGQLKIEAVGASRLKTITLFYSSIERALKLLQHVLVSWFKCGTFDGWRLKCFLVLCLYVAGFLEIEDLLSLSIVAVKPRVLVIDALL